MKTRKIKLNPLFNPPITKTDDIELYPNGIFDFNITKILEDIEDGILIPVIEKISLHDWFREHYESTSLDESFVMRANIEIPVIQAEIRIGRYELIDGNHRMAKANHTRVSFITSYKISGEQLANYCNTKRGYEAYVKYWNEKLKG